MTTISPQRENPRMAIRGLFSRMLAQREIGVGIILAVTVVIVGFVNPSFIAPGNIRETLIRIAPFAIIGCGLTFVIVTGEIDISVGSLMGFLAAIMGTLASPSHANLPVPLALLITIATGTGIGLLTGALVSFGRAPSIIVTLGMLAILRSCTESIMRGEWIKDLPEALRFFGTGSIFAIPVSVWTTAIVVTLAALAAQFTPLGRRIYAVGSNPHAAVLAGVSPKRIKLFAFALTGFLTAVATIVSVPQLRIIDPGIGLGVELFVVTAVVVGGTSISGGKGTILGTLLAVILLVIIRSALLFLKLGDSATYWERAIQGAFILIAVLLDHFARGRSAEEE